MSVSRLCLFRRNNGIYYVRLEVDGRRLWRSTGRSTKHDAIRRVAELRDLFKPKVPPRSLSQYAEEYKAYGKAHLAPGTLVGYVAALDKLKASVGDVGLRAVTEKQADAFIAARAAEVKPVTVNIELRSLRAVFSVAMKWGYIPANPFREVKTIRIPQGPPVHLSQAEFGRLLAAIAEGWLRDTILFAVATGLRRNEIVHLRWSDIDLERGLVHVRNTEEFRTKSRKDRVVPLSAAVVSMLRLRAARPGCECVFHRRGRRISPFYLTHKFKAAARKAKLPEAIKLHSLRHSCASWMLASGVSILAVKEILGHSSVSTTALYGHVQRSDLAQAVETIVLQVG